MNERGAKLRDQFAKYALWIGLGLLVSGCEEKPAAGAGAEKEEEAVPEDIAEWATGFESLTLVTPKPVAVNPELLMLCQGAFEADMVGAREKYGPHSNGTLKIYMTPGAVSAFDTGSSYPVGAVIVKEKWLAGYLVEGEADWVGGGDGVGGMVKREAGYDPENGDWEYFYVDENEALRSGRMKTCVECHRKAKGTDYVFGSWGDEGRAEY